MRGVMIAYSSFTVTLGILFINTLNTFMPWRHVGLVCMCIPIMTVIGLLLVSKLLGFNAKKNPNKNPFCIAVTGDANMAASKESND